MIAVDAIACVSLLVVAWHMLDAARRAVPWRRIPIVLFGACVLLCGVHHALDIASVFCALPIVCLGADSALALVGLMAAVTAPIWCELLTIDSSTCRGAKRNGGSDGNVER